MNEPKQPAPNVPQSQNGKQEKTTGLDLEIRSEEVQEIIGRPPHWLVRGGIGMLFGVLILIFTAASFIRYPEVIKSELTFVAINAPKIIESKINGKVTKLFKENKSKVIEGEVLGWMESTADHKSVETLEREADSLYKWAKSKRFDKIRSSQISSIQNLGELQSNVQAFNQIYWEYLLVIPGGYYPQRKTMLEEELNYTGKLLSKLQVQKEIQEADFEITKQEFDAQKQLADKNLIAKLELLKAERELANKRLPLQQTESAIINNRMAQIAKAKEIMELDKKMAEQISIFSQSLYELKSAIEEWRFKYVLTASVSGTVTYSGIVQEQQIYRVGDGIFYIQPKNTDFLGEMKISQASFGKIEEGQLVLVRFSGFPYHEFGSVTGTIEYFSEFPVDDSLFFAKVSFPEGLKTNYGKMLPSVNGMKGQAEIITQDMRLLKRVYNNLTKEIR